ncbi:MAG: EF2563 family selenium-dependent molybdenum hydroxylase system protein [Chloroflexi bacterium]|nr:EF2563 family selenium-dependent molybdenum hydroxylase system protein [Chloroflexota bacterium]
MRGGGDLASGVAVQLKRAGINVIITELEQPLVVRRLVSFAQAVFTGTCNVEEFTGHLVKDWGQAETVWHDGDIPVLVDPKAELLGAFKPNVLVDARMTKLPPETGKEAAAMVIGLGPGFVAGENCHAVIETVRGRSLGQVIWSGAARPNTGMPGLVGRHSLDRVLRAPADGELIAHAQICDVLKRGELIAEVADIKVTAPFDGVLRGLIYPGLQVKTGLKIGDMDARDNPRACTIVSDKALAIGNGVLEAILARQETKENR